ncbi:protein kinase [Sorangium sp. So ce367]|uniref:serine/threonine-protein kinase n=1 Tax=Sorangium sp. So ce367 TaxID=3133305 RepID=UPI003F60CBA5
MSTALADGSVFARRYRVVRLIASGAMGAVHEVVHLETERHRALKVMHAHLFESEEMRERFKREARIAANIESEHIVDVFDAGVDEATGMPFLVMELLRGEELGERLKRVGRLQPDEAVTYLYQAALALDRTHAANIVHRDLKPANLFLSQCEDGSVRVKILDFGVAKLVADGATAAGATRSLGTPLYMAPEQFHVGKKLTGAADIYALGMMAYALLVGLPYWDPEANEAGDVIAFAMLAVRGPQEPPVQRARSVGVMLPPGFDAWFARATAVDPAARFRKATEAVHALGEVFGMPVGGGRRASFPSAPSYAGMLQGPSSSPARLSSPPSSPGARPSSPSSPELSPALMRTESALGTTPSPEHLSGSHRVRLTEASTGAATTSLPPKPRRAPIAAGMALLGVAMLVVAALWIAQRAESEGEPAVPDVVAASPLSPGQGTAPPAGNPTALDPSAAAPQPSAAAPEPAAATPEPSAAVAPAPASAPPPTVTPSAEARVHAAPPRSATAPVRPNKPTTTAPRPVASGKAPAPIKPAPSTLFGRY